ncbi:class I SAM-dependent methyltransferase [Streptomyces sp. NBC_00080]|nr:MULTISPECIES: hypothetical protein [Streptomyces]
MLPAAARYGRRDVAALLLADACRLPLSTGTVDAIFSAGLVNHLSAPLPTAPSWSSARARSRGSCFRLPGRRRPRAAQRPVGGHPRDPGVLVRRPPYP